MGWEKSSPETVERFARALPEAPEVQRRKMFGYDAAFARGNMFAGLWQTSGVIVRLGEADRERVMRTDGGVPFQPMPTTTMKEYVLLPEKVVADEARLEALLGEAFRFAMTLPPKEPKPRKPKKA